MQKYFAYLKNDFVLAFKSWQKVIILYLFLPICLMAIMTLSMSSVFQAESTDIELPLAIENLDQGHLGKSLQSYLAQEPLKEYFQLEEDAAIKIVIPKNFSANPAQENIEIITSGKYSQIDLSLVKNFMQSWHQTIIDQQNLAKETQQLEGQQAEAFNKKLAALNQSYQQDFVSFQAMQTTPSLKAVEYYFVVAILYICMIGMNASTTFVIKDDFKGLNKRLAIVPLNQWQKTFFNWSSNTLQITFFSILLMILVSFYPAFTINTLWTLIPWMLVYAGLFIGLGQVLSQIGSKMAVMVSVQVISLLFAFVGIVPMGDIIGGEFGQIFKQNWGQKLFFQPMQDILLGHHVFEHGSIYLILLGLVFILVLLNYLISRRKAVA